MEVTAHVGKVFQKGFCVCVVNVSTCPTTAGKRALLNAILLAFAGPVAAP
jgi:hypothetical protein